jgi:small subunit ribosomal protein S6
VRTYDVVFILDEKRLEDNGESFANDVAQFVASLGGEVKERNIMGRRIFTRPIGKHTAGLYWEFVTDLDPAKVAEFKEKYRLNSTVLRLAAFHYVPSDPRGKDAVTASRM